MPSTTPSLEWADKMHDGRRSALPSAQPFVSGHTEQFSGVAESGAEAFSLSINQA